MKRIILSCFMLTCITFGFAQISFGPYTMFPNSQKAGSAYKPKLAFGKIDNQYLLVLLYVDKTDYVSFNDESVLLLKFDNDSVDKLSISKTDYIVKEHESEWLGYLRGGTAHYYKTYASFNVGEDVIDKIVKKQQNIKKIRVSFTNGDIKDWDIDLKYQPKFVLGLSDSYKKVQAEDAVRKEKINNVESDF